jgi:bidirectional [NiFe] hydrogenase diaphorase subunit
LSEVYGVATYYHYFSLKPPGQHTCVVCMGTGCYVKGSANLMKAIEDVAHVTAGETTADGKVSVVAARCIGSCSLSPAVVFDGEVMPKAQPEGVKDQIRRWLDHDAR